MSSIDTAIEITEYCLKQSRKIELTGGIAIVLSVIATLYGRQKSC